ncbi:YdcF family protein [Loigolactobacillus zhaoyuanensis]|uniref:YdcF family protein n=1 Tax=Loigolactobacillus zhaoyuanensis TaxID=2486017 RepID=A0ABW8U9T0_9LACO|nr:YdcF family protein [Loigolactobacillus zhaoyuanensis]
MQITKKIGLAAVATGAILLAVPLISCPKAPRQRLQRADVIVVPGSGYSTTKNGRETELLKSLLDQAVRLYRQGLASYILVSGSVSQKDFVGADVMARGLIRRGIPRPAIICERHARSVAENFAFARPLLVDFQLIRAIVVASPWRLREASCYARQYGIQHTVSVAPAPARMTKMQQAKYFMNAYCKMLRPSPLDHQNKVRTAK